jgi:hypothetical protein
MANVPLMLVGAVGAVFTVAVTAVREDEIQSVVELYASAYKVVVPLMYVV